MPRITDETLNITFYLYHTKTDAEKGEGGGGCGCFISYPCEYALQGSKGKHVYAVTNRHVIEEMGNDQKNTSPVIRVNTTDNKISVIEPEFKDWIFHPDWHDLAICPIVFTSGYYKVSAIPFKDLLTESEMGTYNLGVGCEIMAVGRFKTHEGKYRNTPVARFGHLAMMPFEPIYNRYFHLEQESFLVECHSASGNSGAPVFIWPSTTHKQVFLLGTVWAHMDEFTRIEDNEGEVINMEWRVKYNMGMMAVVPAWRLVELIESDELKDQRRRTEKALADRLDSAEGGATPDYIRDTDTSPTFTEEDFEEALRKVARQDKPKEGKGKPKEPDR